MKSAEAPQCPECTYPLVGLQTRRCPECGFALHEMLFTHPELAIPKPAWERRPRIGSAHAIWRTLIDVTFRPRRFFQSIQSPDRASRAIWWFLLLVVACAALSFIDALGRYCSSNAAFSPSGQTLRFYLMLIRDSSTNLGLMLLLVLSPIAVMLLIADALLWRNRVVFRLFAKGTLYATTVHLWLVLLVVIASQAVRTLQQFAMIIISSPYEIPPWINWTIAVFETWMFVIIFHALLGARFAMLFRPRPTDVAVLRLLTIGGWALSMYLALFDRYIGPRFPLAVMSQFLW